MLEVAAALAARAGAATIQSREAFMIGKATAIKNPKHRSLYLADVSRVAICSRTSATSVAGARSIRCTLRLVGQYDAANGRVIWQGDLEMIAAHAARDWTGYAQT